VEKYLDRCIQSLLAQTLNDIEIILADDESPAENDLSAYKGYFDYSGIDFSKLNLISETTAVEQKNNESYEVLQFLQENEYVYAIHEK